MEKTEIKILLGSGGFNSDTRRNHWSRAIEDFLPSDIDELLFVPFALADHAGYTKMIAERGFAGKRRVHGLHEAYTGATDLAQKKTAVLDAVRQARAIYVGGGNTFRLLKTLQDLDLLGAIRERVQAGMPYIGVSAGTNLAGPTIQTTNDMPIVQPRDFKGLGLVHFQINPHYFAGAFKFENSDRQWIDYAGETRDDRIREFHEESDAPVLGLWEGSILTRISDRKFGLPFNGRARLFKKGAAPLDFEGGTLDL